MTNRLLLDSSGLSISAPGVDVLTSELHSRAFDSRYPMPKVYTTGAVGISVNNAYFGVSPTVSYGKTFSKVPTVFFYVVLADGLNTSRFAYRRYTMGSYYETSFAASVGTSSISWTMRSRYGPNSRDTFSGTIYYLILDD